MFRYFLLFISLLLTVTGYSKEDILRDRATKLSELTPFMGIFSDFSVLDPPESISEWKQWNRDNKNQIFAVESALKKGMPQKSQFEYREKLFELYLAREVYLRRDIETTYVKNWDLYSRGALNEQPELNFKPAENQLFKAINQLRILVKDHGKHRRIDKVIYELARNLCRIKNNNNAFYFGEFKRSFAASAYSQKAKIAKADCHFDSGEQNKAKVIYEEILASKDKVLTQYAAYRLAWVSLSQLKGKSETARMGLLNEGEKYLKMAVALSIEEDEERLFTIHKNALPELAFVFALQGAETEAKAYFEKTDFANYMPEYYFRYANQLYMAKQYQNSLRVFDLLQKKYKTYKKLPEVLQYMADAYEKLGNHDEMIETLKLMTALVDEDSDFVDTYEDLEGYILEVQSGIEYYMRNVAITFNELGEKKNKKELLLVAESAYRAYLSAFKEHENAYDMSFYLGSLLFKRQAFLLAANQFSEVFKMREKNANHRRDAAYNAVVAWTNIDSKENYGPLPETGTVKEPIEIPKVKQGIISSVNAFVKAYPDDDAGIPMNFTVAQIYLDYGHYDEAVTTFEEIAIRNPESELGRNAIQTVIALYAGRANWETVKEKVTAYLENPKLVQPKMQKILTEALSEAEEQMRVTKVSADE